jgi:ribosome-associated translation inhibitor RaiA
MIPLQITFRHMAPSPALEARIRELVGRLERFSAHIIRGHVTIEPPPQHQRQGGLFDFQLDLSVPGEVIAIRHARQSDRAHENPYVALRDAFRAARRRLQDYERKRRGEVKTPKGSEQSIRSMRPVEPEPGEEEQ